MRLHAQVARGEFVVEPADRRFEWRALEFKPEVANAPIEQLLIRTLLPGGRTRHSESLSQGTRPASERPLWDAKILLRRDDESGSLWGSHGARSTRIGDCR